MAFLGNLFCRRPGEGSVQDHHSSREGIQMLVSGVYVMHEPSQGIPEMDIVFFHGLQLGDYKNAYRETWESNTAAGTKVCWPSDWLGQDFPNARILSISYDSSMLGSEGEGKQLMVKGLLEKLMNVAKIGDGRPVVFVGHSLGGVIIKRLCVEMQGNSLESDAHTRALLHNVRGVFFYATPHGASSFGTMENFVHFPPPLLQLIESSNLVDLDGEFFKVCNYFKCQTKALVETKPTLYQENVVIDLISSSQNALIPMVAIDDADHISICKPKSKNKETYVYLKDFIKGVVKMDGNEGEIKDPERIVEAIRSQGGEMRGMLEYINKCLEGKEGKTVQGKEVGKERKLAKELVEGGVIRGIVEVLKNSRSVVHGDEGVVSEAGWALDNILEYGDPSFFAKAVEAGAVDALVNMLGSHTTAPCAVSVLRNLTYHYLPSHSLLATRESHAKLALQHLSFVHKCPASVWVACIEILTTMDWSPHPYLIPAGGPNMETHHPFHALF